MRALSSRPRRPAWVDAAPFRAHLRHALAVADVPWPAVAIAGGVPVGAVRALLFGRSGRQQARIDPRLAARLLSVDAGELSRMRATRVPASSTTDRLRSLLAAGVDPLQLARWCRVPPPELALLVDGDATTCSRLTEALILAAERLRATPPPRRAAA